MENNGVNDFHSKEEGKIKDTNKDVKDVKTDKDTIEAEDVKEISTNLNIDLESNNINNFHSKEENKIKNKNKDTEDVKTDKDTIEAEDVKTNKNTIKDEDAKEINTNANINIESNKINDMSQKTGSTTKNTSDIIRSLRRLFNDNIIGCVDGKFDRNIRRVGHNSRIIKQPQIRINKPQQATDISSIYQPDFRNCVISHREELMSYEMEQIVEDKGIVLIHGNEYDFGEPCKINGVELHNPSIEVIKTDSKEDYGIQYATGIEIRQFFPLSGDDDATNDVKVNFKDYTFNDPWLIKLYPDFSIKTVVLSWKSRDNKKPLEGIRLSMLNSNTDRIEIQNFYTIDKKKNIKNAKQAITLYISDHENGFKTNCENMSSDEKTKLDLLNYINDNLIKEQFVKAFQITFDGDKAYVLTNDKLYFFEREKVDLEKEKTNSKEETNSKKTVEVKYSEYGNPKKVINLDKMKEVDKFLTAHGDKVFVAYADPEKYAAGILSFDKKYKELVFEVKLTTQWEKDVFVHHRYTIDDARNALSVLDTKNKNVNFPIEKLYIFDKKLKKYFEDNWEFKRMNVHNSSQEQKKRYSEKENCLIY